MNFKVPEFLPIIIPIIATEGPVEALQDLFEK